MKYVFLFIIILFYLTTSLGVKSAPRFTPFNNRAPRLQGYHYELQCYENPMKMSLKTQEGIFQGPKYRLWKVDNGFHGHEIAMKYLALGFMSHEMLVCYRFHGPWKLHS